MPRGFRLARAADKRCEALAWQVIACSAFASAARAFTSAARLFVPVAHAAANTRARTIYKESKMAYNFDEPITRYNTSCLKWDCASRAGHAADELPLWVADMDFRIPQPAIDALVARAQHGVFGYTVAGDDYFEAVAGWFERHHHWRPKRQWLAMTPGVVFALGTAIRAFTQPGEAVLIQPPVYYPFRLMIEQNGHTVANAPLAYDSQRYSIDFEAFETVLVESGAKLFILCNPHNPVGRAWSADELRRLGDICLKHSVTVVADEIHADFARPGHTHVPFASLGEAYEQSCVVCTAPSKTFNLAGLQVSNIFIPNPKLRHVFKEKLQRTGFGEINAMGLAATKACYEEGDEWLRELKAYLEGNLDVLRDACERIEGVHLVEPESTYLPWIDCRELGLTDNELTRLIEKEAKLWLDMGTMFGTEGSGFVRMNIATQRSNIEEACSRLEHAIAARH